MFGAIEKVRDFPQRDIRGCVAELTRDEDIVRALRDKEARERVPQIVEPDGAAAWRAEPG